MSAITLNRPAELVTLASTGWLVQVGVHVTTMRKSDPALAQTVAEGAQADAAEEALDAQHKLIVRCPEFKKLLNHRQTVDNWMKTITYPWGGKQRYLCHHRLAEFEDGTVRLVNEFNGLIDAFLGTPGNEVGSPYEIAVGKAAFERGALFKREHYPSAAELRRRFRMRIMRTEVPMGDYRVQIGQQAAEDCFAHYTREVSNIVQNIASEQAETMVQVLKSLSHGLDEKTAIKPDGTRKVTRNKVVRSTYDKALKLCESIAKCNPSNNTALEDARAELLAALSASNGDVLPIEVLRDSDSRREVIKEKVDNILSVFTPVAPIADDDEF
jgi:dsDNA-binding SOS-regulon protein